MVHHISDYFNFIFINRVAHSLINLCINVGSKFLKYRLGFIYSLSGRMRIDITAALKYGSLFHVTRISFRIDRGTNDSAVVYKESLQDVLMPGNEFSGRACTLRIDE